MSLRVTMNRKDRLASREEQLNLLHQEILMKREALLHTSTFSRLGPHGTMTSSLPTPADARTRNAKLLNDIGSLDQRLREHINSTPSPRFITLQDNYWSMVRSLLPLWEQSLPDGPWTRPRRQQQSRQQHQQQQSLPRDRSTRPRRQRGVAHARATK